MMTNGQPFVVRMVLPKNADQVAVFARAVAREGRLACDQGSSGSRLRRIPSLRVAVQTGRLVKMRGQWRCVAVKMVFLRGDECCESSPIRSIPLPRNEAGFG